MKAERRHELQTNTLSQFIHDLPIHLQTHANKILVGIIVICLIYLLVRHRMNAAEETRQLARSALVQAREAINHLKTVDRSAPNDMARVQERKKTIEAANDAIETVLNNTSDPKDSAVRAEAFVARGDLHWAVANLPTIPGAATMPAAMMPTTNESLASAQTAYEQALHDYGDQKLPKVTALLGMAAIEETRGDWDKAVENYNLVTSDATAAEMFKEVARMRLAVIPDLRKPVYLGAFSSTQPTSSPSTEPATSPSSMPSSPPSTGPVVQPTSSPGQ